jgi:hypothetical protein
MSFKLNPRGSEERKYITKAGIYEMVVKSATPSFLPPRNDFYVRIALETHEGETVFADIFQKPEKNGSHSRLNDFVASTANEAEVAKYIAQGEINLEGIDGEEWVKLVTDRAIGRRLKVKVTERKYVKKDGTEGVAYQGSFFYKHPDGPELPF